MRSAERIRVLASGKIDERVWIVGDAAPQISGDADDGQIRRAQVGDEPLPDGLTVRPGLLREPFVDDDDRQCPGAVVRDVGSSGKMRCERQYRDDAMARQSNRRGRA